MTTQEVPAAHCEIRGSGRDVLVLHGWGASGELMMPIVEPLAANFRCIVPDFPGFGKTPPPSVAWSMDDYMEWTIRLLDRLGVEKVDVIGHSFGGRVAIKLATTFPQRMGKIVLTGSAGVRPRHGVAYQLRVRSFKAAKWIAMRRNAPALLKRWAHKQAEQRGSDDYRAAHGTMRGTLVRVVNEDLTPLLAQVTQPTLLVWGSDDDVTPLANAQLMQSRIPDSGVVTFDNAGHYAYLEQPQRFAHIVDTFLGGAA